MTTYATTPAALLACLTAPGLQWVVLPLSRGGTAHGILRGVDREDSSGRSFNVHIIDRGEYRTVYVRYPAR